MGMSDIIYHVVLNDTSMPPMYGIESATGASASRISTDYQEVSRLVQCYNCAGLSPIQLSDAVEDFRHS